VARIHTTLGLEAFDREHPEGMVKSDQALLYYVISRIVDAGGLPPDDFRADPRIEYPELVDVPAMFTVGQEFLIAWTYALFGGDLPLHVFCVIAMGIVASLAAVGVYGFALAWTRSVGLAVFAAAFWALTPGAYRTLGFIILREDLSIPLLALHGWSLARAARSASPSAFAACGVTAVLAAATWHAMAMILTGEALVLFAWYLRTGSSPLRARGAVWLPVTLGLGALIVPVLHAKGFAASLPVLVAVALWLVGWLDRDEQWRARTRVALGATALLVLVAGARWVDGGAGDYAHVADLLLAKLRYLGSKPDDLSAMPFGARMLWMGPFRTPSASHVMNMLGAAALLVPLGVGLALPIWWRGRGDTHLALLTGFLAAGLVATFFTKRLVVLPCIMAPIVAVGLLRLVEKRVRIAAAAALLVLQALVLASWLDDYGRHLRGWYKPTVKEDLIQMVDWIRENLPPEGAIAADFVTSPALLAHTGHPVVLQPKYETRRSRDRIERFVTTLFHGSPEEFERLLREDFKSRYLLVSLRHLWGSRTWAGLPASAARPPEGSAAWSLLTTDAAERPSAGLRLLHASSAEAPRWRLYAIEEDRAAGEAEQQIEDGASL
jgi:hypothetical protein